MVENIAINFEKAMKKGFMSTLILLVLEKNPTHGYDIIKKIEKRTLGLWTPSASSIYTVLKNLEVKELIQVQSRQDTEKPKIIYELTPKGQNTLKMMLKKYEELKNSMNSIIASTFEEYDDLITLDAQKSSPFDILFNSYEEVSEEKKIKLLNIQKQQITEKIENFKNRLQKVEKLIAEIQK